MYQENTETDDAPLCIGCAIELLIDPLEEIQFTADSLREQIAQIDEQIRPQDELDAAMLEIQREELQTNLCVADTAVIQLKAILATASTFLGDE